ncbi:MAG: ABC transporter ATP-binding protein [Fervidobacterium sp.]|nr:ABC transporter ATP-binding protein [Fervidobacterium sp.]
MGISVNDVILSVKNLEKFFGKLKVIENLSFELLKGESVAFLGPSGCGKTTLLKIVAGIDKNYNGYIQKYFSKIGYVFQEPRLIPWKNVLENILFVYNDEQRALSILKTFSLENFAHYLPSKLSGGMKQRVNLARALISDPEVLFLDEPFASLDVHMKLSIIEDIIEKRKIGNFSMILVTHDIREALLLADRIILLSDKPSRIIGEFKTKHIPKNALSEEFQKMESAILSEIMRRWSV